MRHLLMSLLLFAAALLSACDTERAARLEEGLSTEADVRREFGEPVQITERADGSKLLAYPRQPEGWTNYEAEIGADGKLAALRQLLTEANFAKVQPGMPQAAVAKLLGRHARELRYANSGALNWARIADAKNAAPDPDIHLKYQKLTYPEGPPSDFLQQSY